MNYFRWALVALNILAAIAVAARLESNLDNRGMNGFLLGINLMAAVWQTTSLLDGS